MRHLPGTMSMTTLTPTDARLNLSRLLRRALRGEDIGIVVEGKIVALRPVSVESKDYAMREYGVTKAELKAFEKRTHEKTAKARKAGMLHESVESLMARKGRR
jgi:antitoxin (DNA-binding transcriptional repressor) of toxin-antitoxin stability system